VAAGGEASVTPPPPPPESFNTGYSGRRARLPLHDAVPPQAAEAAGRPRLDLRPQRRRAGHLLAGRRERPTRDARSQARGVPGAGERRGGGSGMAAGELTVIVFRERGRTSRLCSDKMSWKSKRWVYCPRCFDVIGPKTLLMTSLCVCVGGISPGIRA